MTIESRRRALLNKMQKFEADARIYLASAASEEPGRKADSLGAVEPQDDKRKDSTNSRLSSASDAEASDVDSEEEIEDPDPSKPIPTLGAESGEKKIGERISSSCTSSADTPPY